MSKFYITTAIPYVNAKPHVGHALEFVQADVVARYHRQKGDEVLLLSGSDENALKNVQAAEQAGVPVQQFVDENARLFSELAEKLNIEFNVFQKGSDPKHHASSQELWKLCQKAGDIYKSFYEGLYCVGCETFYTPEELDENLECFEHPGKKLEKVKEENYFFKLSKYQERLIELIQKDELNIVPSSRKNEILSFLKQTLQDISISRSNERAKNWGVPVPGDDSQRMFVWFDALNIYQSGIGFGSDQEIYKKWWPADVHVIGKGIIRFHTVYWPAFLLSAGLPLPKTIFVHGYITVEGAKMSKSVGNVIDPFELVVKYGADAVRYFFLRELPATEDGDFSFEKFETRYNADLAGGLGNLVARLTTMAEGYVTTPKLGIQDAGLKTAFDSLEKDYPVLLEEFRFSEALSRIWELISLCDKHIERKKPWEKQPGHEQVWQDLIATLASIGWFLEPFLPETSHNILNRLGGALKGDGGWRVQLNSAEIKRGAPLFPRIET